MDDIDRLKKNKNVCFYNKKKVKVKVDLPHDFENKVHLLKTDERMWKGYGFLDAAANATGRY